MSLIASLVEVPLLVAVNQPRFRAPSLHALWRSLRDHMYTCLSKNVAYAYRTLRLILR